MANEMNKWETREEPRFVNFNAGDCIAGLLLSMQPIQINDKPSIRYVVKLETGELVAFIGTYQLNQKLRKGDTGREIMITCTGEDPHVKRGENCMKIFDVKVSLERKITPPSSGANSEITDEDIPF